MCFTSKCIFEAMHVHASDKKLSEGGSAKFLVMENGEMRLQVRGTLNDREILKIQRFIKGNYRDMYALWEQYSSEGFCRG